MSNPSIIIPAGMNFNNWASQLMFIAPQLNLFYPPPTEKGWREWANYSVYTNQAQYPLLPLANKSIYPHDDSWRDWGSLFTYLVL
jgi:hypothetical protein